MPRLHVAGRDRVAVCVCTAFRPKMLEACLVSLREQMVDASLVLEIVVVDNEPEPNNRDAVESIAYGSVYPIHYVHQPKRGIAAARNAALMKALEIGADWIAFTDDDAVAEPDWLAQLMHPDYRDVPVLAGTNLYVYPKPMPFWVCDEGPKGREGEDRHTAGGGNVRFSIDLVKAGLRFEERLGLMGGEDTEFFIQARAKGFRIKRTLRAITRETAHPERLTYRGQMYRSYWCAAAQMRRWTLAHGWLGALVRKAHTIPVNVLLGLMWLAGALFVLLVSKEAFRDGAIRGGKKLAKAAGRFAALAGHLPQPYRVVMGL